MTTMVPQELVTEMLSYLPVKSLLRFKCACTSWYHLINSPFFVNLHLTTAVAALQVKGNNNYTILTECTSPVPNPDPYSSRLNPCCFSLVSGDTFRLIREVLLHDFGKPGFRFSGPCNGLFCLIGKTDPNHHRYGRRNALYTDDIALWNPATRKLEFLPCSPSPAGKYSVIAFGFGVISSDSDSDYDSDYKVVKIVCVDSEVSHLFMFESTSYHYAYVYSTKKKCWTEVSSTLLPPRASERSLIPSQCCGYHNGSYYWFNLHTNTLLSFDMHSHAFHISSLPIADSPRHWGVNFGAQGDSLVVVVHYSKAPIEITEIGGAGETWYVDSSSHYHGQACYRWYEIWVRNEASKTWTRQAVVEDYPFMHTRVCMKGTTMVGYDGGHLVSYNLETQEEKRIRVYYKVGSLFTIVPFVESLVSAR